MSTFGFSQEKKPKLVVGIVVDQMRYDYLTRFINRYGEGGFKRLMNEGFNCKNNHFNYVPTATGPGHASVYTGTTPKYHGIIGNNWYDKENKEDVYCAGDNSVNPVGTKADAGKMSPHRMLTTTFTDENRLHTQMRGKTIGIAIKDRGAILPAGHTANAAYWFEGGKDGNWITSSFYLNELPEWVETFNKSDIAKSYLKTWDTYYPIDSYVESGSDKNNFEGGFKGKDDATFPYDLKSLSKKNGNYNILKATAYGNDLTTDFALAAIQGEQLGADNDTDVLTVSYSSTDYVGHNFGVNSKEIQDTYIRLDKNLENLLNQLDKNVGKGNYTVFLTADHGAVDVPSYLASEKIPAGYFDKSEFKKQLSEFSISKYGEDLIEHVDYADIFFDREKIKELGLHLAMVQLEMIEEIINYKNVYKAYTATEVKNSTAQEGIELLLKNGYNQKRSGEIMYVLNPATISYSKTGSSHGSAYNYDTHVPLLFYGTGVKQGHTYNRTNINDIAPTMSALLGIAFPNGTSGTVVSEAIK
ncbi:alkaline phosphatase family protein [Urechidicola sp. KH5]